MEKLKNRSEIGIYALGGLGEVGANMYVIDYLEQLFVIDCGVLFPDDYLLGVDYVIPDFTYLKKNEHKIVGLFITHGHEDHIGGIPFLLKQVRIPCIYAAGVTTDLIQNKLQEYPDLLSATKFKEFNSTTTYSFKDVVVSFIRLNHSIPDMFGIVFETSLGKIFHTGDFKFDFTPVGPQAEYEKLAKLGSEGCLCMLADSTNALRDGFTLSESKIGATIHELFSEIKDRVIVATFASNMFRVQQIIEACIAYGRHIAIFGRSMEKTIEVGQQVGYIKAPKGTIIDSSEIDKYKPNEICLLCTGSQGEPMAALSRIANGSHKTIQLIPSDTVIFSSNPIPGNQEGVNRTINLLFKKGANVITNSPINDTHTTGHASQGELKLMLTLVKPKFFMPIHGEYRMQRVHGDLAVQTGVDPKNVFILENGDVLAINDHSARIAGHVPAGEVYIDGSGIGDVSGTILKERKTLADDGMFSLVITIDSKKKTIPIDPQVVSRGFIFMKDSEELTKYFVEKSKEYLNQELAKDQMLNLLTLKKGLTDELSTIIYQKTDRKPMVIPIFMDITGK